MYLSGGSQWHSHPSGAWKMSAGDAERMLVKHLGHEIVRLAVSTVVIDEEDSLKIRRQRRGNL